MELKLLTWAKVLTGYDAVSQLYPYIPSMSIWRSWEYAAYNGFKLAEPAMDIGCGDGQFFRLVWPNVKEVIGVDIDRHAVMTARLSGVYKEVIETPINEMSFPPGTFSSAFANCSIEHMDHLNEVLTKIHQCLRPGGIFILSVVTEKFIEWSTLPLLISSAYDSDQAMVLQNKYEEYHHLVNPLPIYEWVSNLEKSGFQVLKHIPILPEMTSRLFLFIDHLWHVPKNGGELGDTIHPFLNSLPDFPQGLRDIFSGIMRMERDWSIGSGAIFLAKRF